MAAESGQGLRRPKGRTWDRRGRTPVVRVTAQGSKRVSVAALVCTKPGAAGRARLIYRTHLDRGHGKHRRKGFTATGYACLLDSRKMRQLIAARSWLTVFQLRPTRRT
jgi:hypothetical protein